MHSRRFLAIPHERRPLLLQSYYQRALQGVLNQAVRNYDRTCEVAEWDIHV